MDVMTMDLQEVRKRYTVEGNDLNVQAAGAIVKDFGNGSLFEWPGVRKHLRWDGESLRFYWGDLAKAVHDQDEGLIYLSSSAQFALELACALATGSPLELLGYRLCGFDGSNAVVVLNALAIALHTSIIATEPDYR